MLSKRRLTAADDALVPYCPTCRTDVPAARTDPSEDEDAPLRCSTCGDLLELAEVTVTDVDTSTVDMDAILEDLGLPPGSMRFHRLAWTHFAVIEDAARVM